MEEPMLHRINRLDNILRHLEELRSSAPNSPKSSRVSTASTSSDGHPDTAEKGCRPVDEVMMEVEQKGTLIQRLGLAEERIYKMCEEDLDGEDKGKDRHAVKKSPSSRLKKFAKSFVGE